jgi:hypothetical protein
MKEVAQAFEKAIMAKFDDYFDTFGFKKVHNSADQFWFSVIYRNGKRYVSFRASLHPVDYPFLFAISFGEGSNEFPDSDWNAIALFLFVKSENPADFERCKKIFSIEKDISQNQIVQKVESARQLLEKYGEYFLRDNLDQFRQLRAQQNKIREPYRILSQKDGKRSIQYEESSSELKEKYSK